MGRYLAVFTVVAALLAPTCAGAAVPGFDTGLPTWLTPPGQVRLTIQIGIDEIGADAVLREALLALLESATLDDQQQPVITHIRGAEKTLVPQMGAAGPGNVVLALRIVTRVALRQAWRLLGGRRWIPAAV